MSIKFLNAGISGNKARPTGYKYPLGISGSIISTNVAPLTTGGTITADGSGPTANMVHTFTTSGTFTSGFTGGVEYLIVAGGGGGGPDDGGGGGAGGLRYGIGLPVTNTTAYTVTVGAGGSIDPGTNGSNSCFGSTISCGGGSGNGGSGGSGGGGRSGNNPGPGTGVPGQGNPGGAGGPGGGGGGGGASSSGNPPPSSPLSGPGGSGCTFSISGSPVIYAGGGGGGGRSTPGTGGPGGGGCGGSPGAAGGPATANRGGGGGGGSGSGIGVPTCGASGVVIVRYIAICSVECLSIN